MYGHVVVRGFVGIGKVVTGYSRGMPQRCLFQRSALNRMLESDSNVGLENLAVKPPALVLAQLARVL